MPEPPSRTGQRIALFAGSFDPITNGHVDVVGKAVHLADRLVLAVGIHPGKTPLFSAEERLAMLEETASEVLGNRVIEAHFLQLRKSIGPPWSKDHKVAMAAAIVALPRPSQRRARTGHPTLPTPSRVK